MYLKKLKYENVGPIISNDIEFRFTQDGKPVPVVIVGENGTGKSVFLSNITDAFYELAGKAYSNALQESGRGHQYYKAISPDQIRLGSSYLVAYMEFEHNTEPLKYIFKSGDITFSDYLENENIPFDKELDWKEASNSKNAVAEKKLIEHVFDTTVVASFSPMRYEKPAWMGEKYHYSQEDVTFSHGRQFNGYLTNPISVECDSEKTLAWLFDIIADSRADLERKRGDEGYTIVYPGVRDIDLLSISRQNAEKLMSAILGQTVIFRMGNRSNKGRRLRICDNYGNTLVPSLDALSTGQLALFNMFSSIIRYADNDDINLSYKLNEIQGIVLIDEVELHLHSKLQREVLPHLIALFPRVQFIITSHSPLFLLGLQELYGEDNIDIFEMPTANKIYAEDFSEFGKAYQYYSDTQRYRMNIRAAIDKETADNKPLIITEGSTDWKHFKAAYDSLSNDEQYAAWLPQLEFDFLEYEPLNSSVQANCKLQMSCSELKAMCKNYSYTPHKKKIIFIADNDDKDTKKVLGPSSTYVSWGNNVYSFCLPVPDFRKPDAICVEHLYKDVDIKKEIEIGGVKRRVYLGNEFNEMGFLQKEDGTTMFCSDRNACGPNKIAVIDGGDKKKVVRVPGDDGVNYALPKMEFANAILTKTAPFNSMDFSAFVPVFEMIRDILSDGVDTNRQTVGEILAE